MSESTAHRARTLTHDTPARFEIHVQGRVPESWHDRFGGMRVVGYERDDEGWVSVLVGPVQDQAALMGVLQSLFSLQLPLISVELRAIG